MATYDSPRPSSQPVGSTDPAVVKDDLITLDKIATSTDQTVTNRKGGVRKTLLGLEVDAQDAFRLGAGDLQGDYVGGVSVYEESNWTFTYNGQQWGLSGDFDLSTLPYLTTEADPNNDANLAVRGSASQEYVQTEITRGQNEVISGTVYPLDDDVLADGMAVPVGTTHLRVLVGGEPTIVAMLPISSGTVSSLTDEGAVIGGVTVKFLTKKEYLRKRVRGEQIGLYPQGDANETQDCSILINHFLPYVDIELLSNETYNVENTVYISGDGQGLVSSNRYKHAFLEDTTTGIRTTGIVETTNFQTVSMRNIVLNIGVRGNRDSQAVGVPTVGAGEGCGFRLTCGSSDIHVTAERTAGVGFWLSNGGDYGLYTHVNKLNVVTAYTGHEGIILDGAYDQRAEYLEAYFSWDSDRDTDYSSSKVSITKPLATICTGILFYSGSCEVVEMHPSNNRHGFSWGTFGRSGDSYRLRFAHAIGEGSSGAVYLAATDDVTGALLNCHSTRGKSGKPLCFMRSLNNVQIAALNIKIDNQSGYPTEGTYCALDIDGDRAVVGDLRVWATNGKVEQALRINGDNHSVKGVIQIPATNESAGDSIAINTVFQARYNDVDIKILGAAIGLIGASGNTDPGRFKLTFQGVATPIDASYAGFLTNNFFARAELYDYDTGVDTEDKRITSGTIPAANANGSVQTLVIPYTKFFKTPTIKSAPYVRSASGVGTNFTNINCWIAGITDTNLTIKYNIGSATGDFIIDSVLGHAVTA